ncbi:uncharacterized protein BYT42DRAFT_609983 [Radiomyces spectabilis]|uniref:uncharacterized protein n=1 Tax=Radiomyces spectabilis TaxID=64574 RepID=UPI00221F1209|nr:uncharacterized protein BYT42DRAFT_609983 [Radiomyces spectabilis]KAI8394251.1 hypothetical protein BYT42DRAFT_609983 [Radiomyces spectabilis]
MPPERRRIQDEDIPLPQTIFILSSIRTLAIKYNEKHDDDFWDDVERYEAALETLLADFQQRSYLPRGLLQGIEDRAGVRRGLFTANTTRSSILSIFGEMPWINSRNSVCKPGSPLLQALLPEVLRLKVQLPRHHLHLKD